jgi:hypothetical protein
MVIPWLSLIGFWRGSMSRFWLGWIRPFRVGSMSRYVTRAFFLNLMSQMESMRRPCAPAMLRPVPIDMRRTQTLTRLCLGHARR